MLARAIPSQQPQMSSVYCSATGSHNLNPRHGSDQGRRHFPNYNVVHSHPRHKATTNGHRTLVRVLTRRITRIVPQVGSAFHYRARCCMRATGGPYEMCCLCWQSGRSPAIELTSANRWKSISFTGCKLQHLHACTLLKCCAYQFGSRMPPRPLLRSRNNGLLFYVRSVDNYRRKLETTKALQAGRQILWWLIIPDNYRGHV
ncbi:hypothetical protein CDEST_02029 [Colletotrichum destructivum]|uniref:Uncharacterized protein n=1 Tax=Colletotrichum destructivum TaxID=34406 RepID=A0AAX4I192_9PEZI|nr:hypothetical protein CDEST_02029 [Colletotrichum destructivum]